VRPWRPCCTGRWTWRTIEYRPALNCWTRMPDMWASAKIWDAEGFQPTIRNIMNCRQPWANCRLDHTNLHSSTLAHTWSECRRWCLRLCLWCSAVDRNWVQVYDNATCSADRLEIRVFIVISTTNCLTEFTHWWTGTGAWDIAYGKISSGANNATIFSATTIVLQMFVTSILILLFLPVNFNNLKMICCHDQPETTLPIAPPCLDCLLVPLYIVCCSYCPPGCGRLRSDFGERFSIFFFYLLAYEYDVLQVSQEHIALSWSNEHGCFHIQNLCRNRGSRGNGDSVVGKAWPKPALIKRSNKVVYTIYDEPNSFERGRKI
jgi:hypothetical protein